MSITAQYRIEPQVGKTWVRQDAFLGNEPTASHMKNRTHRAPKMQFKTSTWSSRPGADAVENSLAVVGTLLFGLDMAAADEGDLAHHNAARLDRDRDRNHICPESRCLAEDHVAIIMSAAAGHEKHVHGQPPPSCPEAVGNICRFVPCTMTACVRSTTVQSQMPVKGSWCSTVMKRNEGGRKISS